MQGSLFLLVWPWLAIAGTPAAPAQPCAQVVSEEADVGRQVRAALERNGVASAEGRACEPVQARVRGGPGALHVSIEDAAGRRSERTVASFAAAATLIASWARSDVPEPLLSRADPPAAVVLTAANAATHRGAGVGLGAESSVGSDGSVWLGPRLDGCVAVGPICVGAVSRLVFDAATMKADPSPEIARASAELLFGARWSWRWRRVRITPSLGAGMGWLRTRRRTRQDAGDLDQPGDDEDDTDDDGRPRSELLTFSHDSIGLRLEVGGAVGIPLTRTLAIETSLGVAFAPTASTNGLVLGGDLVAPEPAVASRLAVGLRWGAW